MKHLVKLSGIAVVLLVLFTACEKEETNLQNLEGIYEGTLTGGSQKSAQEGTEGTPATTEVTVTGENKIQVYCYSENFDTTFVMNYYEHNDSAYVCYTGEAFEETYGHMLGNGHMGGMMDDMHDGETEWMHHMDEEHENGDEHYGGFDMMSHSFSYTFIMNPDSASDYMHFEGKKQ